MLHVGQKGKPGKAKAVMGPPGGAGEPGTPGDAGDPGYSGRDGFLGPKGKRGDDCGICPPGKLILLLFD